MQTKGKFKTYVTATGVPYGCGEDTFHYHLRSAWHQDPESLPCFGDGQNTVPTIHATDLAGVVVNIIEGKPDTKYIVATDESKHTLSELTTCIAENLGTGQVKNISKDDALTSAAVTRIEHDLLLLDLKIEVAVVKEMTINWVAQTGMIENVQTVINEYKNARTLTVNPLALHTHARSLILLLLCPSFMYIQGPKTNQYCTGRKRSGPFCRLGTCATRLSLL